MDIVHTRSTPVEMIEHSTVKPVRIPLEWTLRIVLIVAENRCGNAPHDEI